MSMEHGDLYLVIGDLEQDLFEKWAILGLFLFVIVSFLAQRHVLFVNSM